MEVPDKGEQLFSSVTACFIDEGRTQEVKSHQLLQLPAQFQDLPDQAVEIILCRVQPVDGEVDWNPKVSTVPPTPTSLPFVHERLFKTERCLCSGDQSRESEDQREAASGQGRDECGEHCLG